MKHLFVSFLALLSFLSSAAFVIDDATRTAIASQERQLAATTSKADSLRLLFNLFDLNVNNPKHNDYGFKLVGTALRARAYETGLDMLRNLANMNMRSDSILDLTLELAKKFPESDDRIQTIVFIRLMKNQAELRYASDEKELKTLQKLIRRAGDDKEIEYYDKLVMLHAMCTSLGEYPEDDSSRTYIDELNELVDQLPEEFYALRNIFYVNAALSYTRAGNCARAVKYDKELIKVIHTLEERNKTNGREFKDYDASYYVIYTRLLENSKALTDEEVENYYRLALEMSRDTRAAGIHKKMPLPSIFYAMHHKNYKWALMLLKGCIDSDDPRVESRRLKLLNMTIEAATALGDKEALTEVYPRYVSALENYINSRVRDKYRALQVVYKVDDMRTENSRLKEEQQYEQRRRWRTVAILCGALALLMLVSVIVLYRMTRKSQRLARNLVKSNHSLEEERALLIKARSEIDRARIDAEKANQLKTDFIDNMSHEVKAPLQALREYSYLIAESIDDHKKKYFMQFADLLLLNSEMVETIVNDVLQLSELHNSNVKVASEHLYLKPICEQAIATMKHRLRPDVEICFRPGNPDQMLFTDRHRLTQVLINLLQNAAKFTEKGKITLGYETTPDHSKVKIFIEDTGIGISAANAERIFERFVKLDPGSQGVGLGLTISRMLVRLMSGDIVLDTSYTTGARFVITLPL